jgi:hypothetical protein
LDGTGSHVEKRFRRKSIGSKAIQAIALIPFHQTNYTNAVNTVALPSSEWAEQQRQPSRNTPPIRYPTDPNPAL